MDRHGSRPHFSVCRATSVDREREFGGVRGGGFVLVGSAVEVSVFVACGVVLVVSSFSHLGRALGGGFSVRVPSLPI